MTKESLPLRVVFTGHVDHGKSTLIGRILHDTDSLPEGKIDMVKKACAAEKMEFEFAFVLDALLEEQKQNITIDTTEIRFQTKRRQYIIIDAPGHKEFLKNMITGASRADAAVLVIAANEGVREQSRRHAYLLSLLGIRQLIVVVNKMDLADFSEKRFERDREASIEISWTISDSKRGCSFRRRPRAARMWRAASKKMKWHRGPTVLGSARSVGAAEAPMSIFRCDFAFRTFIDSTSAASSRAELKPENSGWGTNWFFRRRTKRRRSNRSRNGATSAAGSNRRRFDWHHVERTNFCRARLRGSHQTETPIEANRVHADVFWIVREPMRMGHLYDLRLATQEVKCEVVSIDRSDGFVNAGVDESKSAIDWSETKWAG